MKTGCQWKYFSSPTSQHSLSTYHNLRSRVVLIHECYERWNSTQQSSVTTGLQNKALLGYQQGALTAIKLLNSGCCMPIQKSRCSPPLMGPLPRNHAHFRYGLAWDAPTHFQATPTGSTDTLMQAILDKGLARLICACEQQK